jgi:hypothetical protein
MVFAAIFNVMLRVDGDSLGKMLQMIVYIAFGDV